MSSFYIKIDLSGRVTSGRLTSGSLTTALTTNVVIGGRGTTGTTAGWTPLVTTAQPTTGMELVGSSASSLQICVFLVLLICVLM